MKLRDKVAVITGASSGIGRATAIEFARQGCDLAICSTPKSAGDLAATAASIRALGRRVTTTQVDVADRASVNDFAAKVYSEHGGVHILVNNAGVGLVTPIESMALEDFEWLMGVNFWGVVYVTKAFLPYLMQTESHIVNISSVLGLWASPGQAAYTVSKFAIRGFTDALAQELAHTSVTVSSVYPGAVRTDIAKKARFRAPAGLFKDREAALRLQEQIALTSPERAARIIVRAVKRGQRRVLIGPEAYFMDWGQRLCPSLHLRLLPVISRIVQKR